MSLRVEAEIASADVNLQKALEASMRGLPPGRTQIAGQTHEGGNDPTTDDQASGRDANNARYTIDDCIRDLSRDLVRQLPDIQDPDGDTYVFINPPTKQPEQTDDMYSAYCKYYKKPFLMKSLVLAQASPFFRERLRPTPQHRTLRRLGLVGKLPTPVKYVLDLTPPTEGEDAVYLTASLSCSEGVLYWYQASDIFNVSDQLARGSDEWSSMTVASYEREGETMPEYSPTRHRSAIHRVLAAVQGLDILIDSAPKLWSTAIMAEYFGITSHTCTFLTDHICTWLRVEPNSKFIEVNPEITLRIASGIQNENLARDAFAILVGEEVLDAGMRKGMNRAYHELSTFGRRKDSLPEVWRDRLEYASNALIERHSKDVRSIFAPDLPWLQETPSFKILSAMQLQFPDSDLKLTIEYLIDALKGLVHRDLFVAVFSEAGSKLPKYKIRNNSRLTPSVTESTAYAELWPTQRLWTRSFWESLRSKDFSPWSHHQKPFFEASNNRFRGDSLADLFPRPVNVTEQHQHIREVINVGEKILEKLTLQLKKELSQQADVNVKTEDPKADFPGTQPTSLRPSNLVPALRDLDYEPSERSTEAHPEDTTNQDLAAGSSVKPSHATNHALTAQLESQDATTESNVYHQWMSQDFPYRPKPPSQVNSEQPQKLEEDGLKMQNDQRSPSPPFSMEEFFSPPADNIAKLAEDYDQLTDLRFFDLNFFLGEVEDYIHDLARQKLAPADSGIRHELYRPEIIGTLTSLTDTEWKYLPLWAGGLDDETGAIFSDEVMDATPDAAFSTPGPSIHTGNSTFSSSSMANSDFDMMSDAGSVSTTFNVSTAVADGHSDQLFRGKIYTPSHTTSSTTGDAWPKPDPDTAAAAIEEERQAKALVDSLERAEARNAAAARAAAAATRAEQERHQDTSFDDMFIDDDSGDEDGENEDLGDCSSDSDATIGEDDSFEMMDAMSHDERDDDNKDDDDDDEEDGGVMI